MQIKSEQITSLRFWFLMKERAKRRVKRLWIAACNHDDIPTDTGFAIWSLDNPFEAKYNAAMAVYLRIAHSPNYYA